MAEEILWARRGWEWGYGPHTQTTVLSFCWSQKSTCEHQIVGRWQKSALSCGERDSERKKTWIFFFQKLHTRTFNCECAAIRQLLNTSTIRTTSCVACEAMNNTLGRRTTMSQQSAAVENFCTWIRPRTSILTKCRSGPNLELFLHHPIFIQQAVIWTLPQNERSVSHSVVFCRCNLMFRWQGRLYADANVLPKEFVAVDGKLWML